jgi:hypothetical protein
VYISIVLAARKTYITILQIRNDQKEEWNKTRDRRNPTEIVFNKMSIFRGNDACRIN